MIFLSQDLITLAGTSRPTTKTNSSDQEVEGRGHYSAYCREGDGQVDVSLAQELGAYPECTEECPDPLEGLWRNGQHGGACWGVTESSSPASGCEGSDLIHTGLCALSQHLCSVSSRWHLYPLFS